MAQDLYPRLSSTSVDEFTLADLKNINNPIWSKLSDAEKNDYANVAQQRLFNLFKKLGYKTYRVSTLVPSVITIANTLKVYAAYLSQSGTNDPVATVAFNSLGGALTWTRVSTGVFRGTAIGLFTAGKTFVSAVDDSDTVGVEWTYKVTIVDEDVIKVSVYDVTNTLTDNFTDLRVQITVYP